MERVAKQLLVVSLIVFGLGAPDVAFSQTNEEATKRAPSQIVHDVDDARLVKLQGNVYPDALPEYDIGFADPSLPMERMLLILRRSPAQESALEQFMAEQYDPHSSNFHRWLEPREFGELYGPSDSDLQTIITWLQYHGLEVTYVSAGRVFIEFSGTAATVQAAFNTEIHRYSVRGDEHYANASEPSIPEALAPVVVGVFSLHNFLSTPLHHDLGRVRRDSQTGKWIPVDKNAMAHPLFNVANGSETLELVAPYDFAKIYNVLPLWTAGIDGTGQTIAIAGRSDISLTDVAAFRSAFGLPAKAPVITVNGPDPGVPSAGDKVENSLDVEWSGAVAKGATINFVTSKTTTTDGAVLSATYIIDHHTAAIMSYSYGQCELKLQTAGNAAINSLWQQGAAEGITLFVASGDQGAAACDGGGTPPNGAVFGLQVSGTSSTPYNVAVGGTDFDWANLTTKYWSTTNATNGSSVLGYIPEVPWNGTCVSDSFDKLIGATTAGFDEEETCQYLLNNGVDLSFVGVTGGTGGKSACTTPTSTTPASCAGGYAKPSWQVGTGVPADGKRDVPDLSLFASSGALHSAYIICDSQSAPCTFSNSTDAIAQAVGGTSVASPAMAGIMALVNQKMAAPQGNANYAFYALASKDVRSSCNTNTVASANTCNFYDVVTDNNAVPCVPASVNCTVRHTGDTVGVLNGYKSTTGYDYTTGLGSVNAYNLVNNFHTSFATSLSLLPASLTFPNTAVGSTSASQAVTMKNTGTATLEIFSIASSGTSASSFTVPTKTCGATLAAAASCTFTVAFKPASAGALSASIAVTDNVSGSPQKVTVSGTGTALTASPATLAFGAADVGTTSAAQAVTLTNKTAAVVTLKSISLTGINPTSFRELNDCGSTLVVSASCVVLVSFKPLVAGALTASLSVSSSAATTALTVALSGTASAQPTLKLSATSIVFPTTTHGTTSEASVITVTNAGTTTASLYDIILGGTNPTDFAELSTCGSTLAPSANCSIFVSFTPAAVAKYSASLILYDNAVGAPQTVALSGSGD